MTHDEQASLKFVRVESKDDEASNPEEFNKTTSSFVGVSPLPCLPDDQQLFDTNTDEANREEIKTAGFKGEPTRETGDVIHELDEENNPEDEQLRQKRSANLRPEQRQSQLSRHSEEKVSNNSEPEGGVQPGFNGSE